MKLVQKFNKITSITHCSWSNIVKYGYGSAIYNTGSGSNLWITIFCLYWYRKSLERVSIGVFLGDGLGFLILLIYIWSRNKHRIIVLVERRNVRICEELISDVDLGSQQLQLKFRQIQITAFTLDCNRAQPAYFKASFGMIPGKLRTLHYNTGYQNS